MPASLTVESIILGIHSALRLGRTIQKAYANSLKSKRITLPLPDFSAEITETTIENFFKNKKSSGGKQFLGEIARLDELHDKARFSNLDKNELEEYRDYYKTFFSLATGTFSEINPAETLNLLRIRQWEQGKSPAPTALQMVSGTLVEIGIDYFSQVPGAINTDSAEGKFLKAFLGAIDGLQFGAGGSFKELIVREVVPKLFISAAETAGAVSGEITRDEKLQKFIKATSEGVVKDLYKKIEAIPTSESEKWEEVIQWGQVVFGSMVKNSGTVVFSNASEIFGTDEKVSNLIQSTGLTFLEILLDEDSNQLRIKNVLNADSLDKMMKAALTVVADYPQLIAGDREGIKEIVKGVSSALLDSNINRPDLFPEVLRLVLEQTAGNLELLWNIEETDSKHLLVTATQQILGALSSKPADGRWKPQLTKNQIISLTQDLFDEVVLNPAWVTDKVNEDSLLAEVLDSAFKALEAVPKEQRLSVEVVQTLLQMNLRAVLLNRRVLEKIKIGTDPEKTVVLNAALDLVFSFVFKNETVVDRGELLLDLLDYVFEQILARHPDNAGLVLIQIILSEETGIDLSGGLDSEELNKLVEVSLLALSQHPELLSSKAGIQNVISGVAGALAESGFKQPALVNEFIRLVLENTAGNLDILINNRKQTDKNILVVALKQTLKAISARPKQGKWKPALTEEQVLEITGFLLEEVTMNPEWVKNDALRIVLISVFKSMETIPTAKKLHYLTVQILIEETIKAITVRKQLMLDLQTSDGTKKLAISYSLESLFVVLYDKNNESIGTWTLTQTPVINAIIEHFLLGISAKAVTKEEIDKSVAKVEAAVTKLNDNLAFQLEDLLAALEGSA